MTVSRSWSAVVATLALLLLVDARRPAASRFASRPVCGHGPRHVRQPCRARPPTTSTMQGQVVGYAASRAFVWQNGQMTQLSTGTAASPPPSTASARSPATPGSSRADSHTRCCGTTERRSTWLPDWLQTRTGPPTASTTRVRWWAWSTTGLASCGTTACGRVWDTLEAAAVFPATSTTPVRWSDRPTLSSRPSSGRCSIPSCGRPAS